MFFISGEKDSEDENEFERILIKLDKKGRLVLPLEIRDAMDIKPGEKILLSFRAASNGDIKLKVAKAPVDIESQAYSRNGAYVKEKQNRRCRDE